MVYQTITDKVFRTYNQAETFIHEQFRKGWYREANQPKVVPIEATNLTQRYYSVTIRQRIDRRY